MKTSYFGRASSKSFKGRTDLRFISISRGNKYWYGEKYTALAPTWDMVKMTDKEEYSVAYKKILSKLDPMKVYEELGENAVLLCHEKAEDLENGSKFCHRTMVAEWLEEELWIRGIDVKIEELKDDKQDLKKMLKEGK